MAKRAVTGQLNMFDFFSSLDEGATGEVEMVSLVPNFDEEPQVVEQPQKEKKQPQKEKKQPERVVQQEEKSVMSRTYELDGEIFEIAYLNYNKVRITRGKQEPDIHVFETSKEAVDYYVEKMQELESED